MIDLGHHVVRLWDGKTYSALGVEQIDSELRQHAEKHFRLQEWLPVGLRQILRQFAAMYVLVLCATEAAAFMASSFALRILEIPSEVLVPVFAATSALFVILLPVWLLPTLLAGPIRLSVQNGEVGLQAGLGPHARRSTVSLQNCTYYLGPARLRDHLRTVRRLDGYLILLVPRPSGFWIWRWRPVACGYTPAKRGLWLNFLMVARVQQLVPRVYMPP